MTYCKWWEMNYSKYLDCTYDMLRYNANIGPYRECKCGNNNIKEKYGISEHKIKTKTIVLNFKDKQNGRTNNRSD